MKKWITSKCDRSRAPKIAKDLGISVITAAVLLEKGFTDSEKMLDFLSDEPNFSDPFMILDMDKAVERIETAIEKNEKVCIYGDYDADGVTSTAIMYLYLKSLWVDVIYYIPAREAEGYGLNNGAVDKLKEQGVTLIITVDNGISAYEQIKYANSLGIDTIVTDHHEPPDKLPEACAILDPHRSDDNSPFKFFSGVGVAFKLIMAMEWNDLDLEDLLDRYSDICALGTVADIVSLTGENRTLVKEGLKRINKNTNIGIKALRKLSDISGRDVTSGDIGYILAPRINAGGRIGLSQNSVELLLTDDEKKAEELAAELCKNNARRKEIETIICKAAKEILDSNESIRCRKVIVVAGEGWRQGVIGLAASRIKELYGKPTIVISYDGDSAKGSARSVEGFSMIGAVTYCKDLLTIFGGHPMAAGMSLPTRNIDAFRDKLNEYADMNEDEFFPSLEISAWIKPGTLTVGDVQSLTKLEPYGSGNSRPIFGYGSVEIADIFPLKGGQYVKLKLKKDSFQCEAVSFASTYDAFPYNKGDIVNVAVDVRPNEYNGTFSVSSMVKDIKLTAQDNEKLLRSKRIYEEYIIGKPVSEEMRAELSASRDDFAAVYKYLRSSNGCKCTAGILLERIGSVELNLGKLLIILKAMEQLGLIISVLDGDVITVTVTPDPQKVDLFSAPVLNGIKNK